MSVSPISSSSRFSPAASSTPPSPREGTEIPKIQTVSHKSLKIAIFKSLKNHSEFFKSEKVEENPTTEALKNTATVLAQVIILHRKKSSENVRMSKSLTHLPFTFRFRKKTNGKITFFVEGGNSTQLGEGSFKKVKKCFRVDIDKKLNLKVKLYTVQKIKPNKEDLNSNNTKLETIKDSILIFREIYKDHKEYNSHKPSHIGPKMILESYTEQNKYERLEIFQPYMESTLQDRTLSTSQKLKILIDVADGISRVHQKGYVHRDVKKPNISVDADKTGYLNDFDLVILDGDERNPRPYYAWDHLAEAGTFTRNCDIYGLAFAAVDAILPNFFQLIPEGYNSKTIMDECLQTPGVTKLLLNALGNAPQHPNYNLFDAWAELNPNKTPQDVVNKLDELFFIEKKILEIFVREFKQSKSLEELVRILTDDPRYKGLSPSYIRQIAIDAQNLTTAKMLKKEFQALLESIEPEITTAIPAENKTLTKSEEDEVSLGNSAPKSSDLEDPTSPAETADKTIELE